MISTATRVAASIPTLAVPAIRSTIREPAFNVDPCGPDATRPRRHLGNCRIRSAAHSVTALAQRTQARGFLSPIHRVVPIITTILSPDSARPLRRFRSRLRLCSSTAWRCGEAQMGGAVARRWEVHCPLCTIGGKTVVGLVPRFSKRVQLTADPSPGKNEPALSSFFHRSIPSASAPPIQGAIDPRRPHHPTGMISLPPAVESTVPEVPK